MSSIDSYRFTCLGTILCPIPYRFFVGQKDILPVYIAIYHLEEDIPEHERDLVGKTGDILLGGGSGEAPAMLIKMPDNIIRFRAFDAEDKAQMEAWDKALESLDSFDRSLPSTHQKWVEMLWEDYRQAYMMCAGYETLGWNPEENSVESWLTQHILAFVLTHFPARFGYDRASIDVDEDGSICALLTKEEEQIYNWRKYKNT